MTKEEAESRFKLIGEALEILGDTHKRKLYDDGHDKEVMTCAYKWSPVLLFLDAREQCAADSPIIRVFGPDCVLINDCMNFV